MREFHSWELQKISRQWKNTGGQKRDGVSQSIWSASSQASLLVSTVSHCSLIASRINRNTRLGETAGRQQTRGLKHAAAEQVSLRASTAAEEQSRTWEEDTCSLHVLPLPATNQLSFSSFSNRFLDFSVSNVHAYMRPHAAGWFEGKDPLPHICKIWTHGGTMAEWTF